MYIHTHRAFDSVGACDEARRRLAKGSAHRCSNVIITTTTIITTSTTIITTIITPTPTPTP